MHTFDLIVVGGGIVGMSLVCALQGSGLRIAVIEQETARTDPGLNRLSDQPLLRVSAINAASEYFLQHIGVWKSIQAARVTPYNRMQVWDQDSFGKIAFRADDYGYSHLGHIIENEVIQQSLSQKVSQLADVQCFSGLPQQIIWGENEAFMTLQDGTMLSARLVVGADGAHSWLRRYSAIPVTFREYGHHALVATVRTALAHDRVARQIFHGDGILAFLPLWQDDLCSVVWSLPPERAREMYVADQEVFNRQIAVAFDMQLGLCQLEGQRLTFPLTARYARDFAAHRRVLLGDAAHTIHPLAGQGANLGLMDAAELSSELRRLRQQGKDIGQHLNLRRYERSRKYHAATMLAAMQGFKSLFAGTHPLKKGLRDLGMVFADKTPMIKQTLVQQAMGFTDMPEWLKAERLNLR